MTEVVWTATALSGLRKVRTYIEQFNPQAASRIGTSLVAAVDRLSHFPHRGRPMTGTLRELVVDDYLIRYRIKTDTVFILSVRHAARRRLKPG